MALHFSRDEFAARTVAARQALRDAGLDALLIFGQENHYYLTGFDTSGYVFFQCAVLTADDQPITLLTRLPDYEQAKRTSVIEDIRLWHDAEGVDPANDLKDILAEKGLKGGRVGIELNTYGLTPANYVKVAGALDGWCDLTDGSGVIQALRIVKSPAEQDYVRRAAAIADASLEAMIDTAGPGVFEGEINAAGIAAILRSGGHGGLGPCVRLGRPGATGARQHRLHHPRRYRPADHGIRCLFPALSRLLHAHHRHWRGQ